MNIFQKFWCFIRGHEFSHSSSEYPPQVCINCAQEDLRRRPRVKTKCCGEIRKCAERECVLQYGFAGGGKCIHCKWIFDMMPGQEAQPISVFDMIKAHEDEEGPHPDDEDPDTQRLKRQQEYEDGYRSHD